MQSTEIKFDMIVLCDKGKHKFHKRQKRDVESRWFFQLDTRLNNVQSSSAIVCDTVSGFVRRCKIPSKENSDEQLLTTPNETSLLVHVHKVCTIECLLFRNSPPNRILIHVLSYRKIESRKTVFAKSCN